MEHSQEVFDRLRTVLAKHAEELVLVHDEEDRYYLNTPYSSQYDKELFFGAVQVGKNYVSYHLMPVYMYPDLLDDLESTLKTRMHGKSCFNFRTLSVSETDALRHLTARCVERLRRENVL